MFPDSHRLTRREWNSLYVLKRCEVEGNDKEQGSDDEGYQHRARHDHRNPTNKIFRNLLAANSSHFNSKDLFYEFGKDFENFRSSQVTISF